MITPSDEIVGPKVLDHLELQPVGAVFSDLQQVVFRRTRIGAVNGHPAVPLCREILVGVCRCRGDRKSTRLNSSHTVISYAVFCLKKKTKLLSNVTTPTNIVRIGEDVL